MVTSRKQRSLHPTQTLKRHFKARIFSLPQTVFHRPVDKFIGGLTPAAQFIDTHFHVTSLHEGSFSKQEGERWERGRSYESRIS